MRTKENTIKYLTVPEREMLFQSIQNDTGRHALRNLALFRFSYYCALRAGEPQLLQESEIEFVAGYIQIYCRRKKNSNNNTIRILDEDVIIALKEYLKIKPTLYPESSFLFPSQKGTPLSRQMLDRLMKRYCEHTSIPKEKQHFHILKHTRAVDLSNMGFDTKEVQWWLGHKNINNTLIYMQFTTYQQEALYAKYNNPPRLNILAKRKDYYYNEKSTL